MSLHRWRKKAVDQPDIPSVRRLVGRPTALIMGCLLAVGSVPTLTTAANAEPSAPAAASKATGTPIAPSKIQAEVPVDKAGTTLGAIASAKQTGNVVQLAPEKGAIRVTFLDDGNFRLEATPEREFSDPANTPAVPADAARSANIVIGAGNFTAGAVDVADAGGVITMKTPKVTLEADKKSGAFTLKRADGSVVWQESSALSFGSGSTTQHLKPQKDEQFLGGGMQNGRVVHTGSTINISKNFKWDDGGHPNAVPYYMTSAGYGVLRNTFAPGSYTFTEDETTTHKEKRFDAYYFVGDYKQNLDNYTKLTGRPSLPSVFALEYGDADCYNRSNPTYNATGAPNSPTPKKVTFDSVVTAKEFKANDMPAGWMIVNDGYGCEYTPDPAGYSKDTPYNPENPDKGLGGTAKAIAAEANLKTGLWTERSLTNQPQEVGQDGIALRKLDVAWVGEGYRQALTACESSKSGLEQYSNGRGNTLMVEGWAGAQRCGAQWTGDHVGTLDQARWGVPALAGATNSGQAFTTSDVDGIFGGSSESYVRDLQWKVLAPQLYSMSGWAPQDKRPWLYGEAATEINRKYLQLRQQLMPYIYSLSVDAHNTGVGMMRNMPLEFPGDPLSYTKEAETQFMLGANYLVAPVSTSSSLRNGIVLPAGTQWVDYWTGKLYQGGQILNGYEAPLETLPLFVRAGAVVPQGEIARNASLLKADSPITVDVYPSGASSFSLNEDDNLTREYANGKSSKQEFKVSAPEKDSGDVTVTIGARVGDFSGKAASRPYKLAVHSGSSPKAVKVGDAELTKQANEDAFKAAETGWFFDADDAGGTVHVKVGAVASDAAATVVLTGSSAVGGSDSDATAAQLTVALESHAYQGKATTASVSFTNHGSKAKTDVKIVPEAPKGWTVGAAKGDSVASVGAGATVQATFELTPGAEAAGGRQKIGATATYKDSASKAQSVKGSNELAVAYSTVQSAFDTISVTTTSGASDKQLGNFDGAGFSFSAPQLKSAAIPAGGVVPGSTVTVDKGLPTEVNYTWPEAGPDVNNSVSMNGQAFAVSGKGTQLAILGSAAANGGANPELTLSYADGTVQKQTVYFPNWLINGDLKGAKVAIESKGRNNKSLITSNPTNVDYQYKIYSSAVRLLPGKELASVTLPVAENVKVFDWKVIDTPLPEAPSEDAFVSDLTWTSATNGYGVIGKDVANKDTANSPDLPLTIIDKSGAEPVTRTYEKGLGVHAASNVSYYLGEQCTRFTTEIGLESTFNGKIIFTIVGDGETLYQSRTFTNGFAPENVDLDVSGYSYLDLRVDPVAGGSITGAHGIWGNAKLTCAAKPVDTTAPVTTATVDPAAPAETGWYTTAPTVSLSATDDTEVSTTEYRIGDGPWLPYSEAFTVPEGVTDVAYRSTDTSGNLEEEQALPQFKVDTVAPEISASAKDRVITVKAEDTGSGIERIEYSTDGGQTWQDYSDAIKVGAEGVSLSYRATDEAGLTSSSKADVVVPPKEKPVTSTPTISAPSSVKVGAEFTVSLEGLADGKTYELWIHSEPLKLGTVKASSKGTATVTAKLPVDFELKVHQLRLVLDGETVASSAIEVTAAGGGDGGTGTGTGSGTTPGTAGGTGTDGGSKGSGLSATGGSVAGPVTLAALLLIGGMVALVTVRRRRTE